MERGLGEAALDRQGKFSPGDKEGQCFIWVRSKGKSQETVYGVGEEGAG